MPQLGETVTEGTITRWLKQVGDPVAIDEALFEVSTDKVDSEVPSPASGYLSEILVAEGETVAVGTTLAVVSETPPAAVGVAGAGGETAQGTSGPGDGPSSSEPTSVVAREPDEVSGVPPVVSESGSREEPAEVAAPGDVVEHNGAGSATPSAPPPAAALGDDGVPGGEPGEAKVLSPVVRRLLAEHGLRPEEVPGSGLGGRVTRADVLAYVAARGSRPPAEMAGAVPSTVGPSPAVRSAAVPSSVAPMGGPPTVGSSERGRLVATESGPRPSAPAGPRDEVVPFNNIRRRTAEHMVRSKATSAHTLAAIEVDFERVERVRRAFRERFREEEGFGLTYLPFVARAVVDAVREYPHVNASVGDDALIVHRDLHLGIAVDLDNEGLIAPVIHDADTKRLRALAREIADLAGRARSRKLTADDIAGGTFTITNPGPFGTLLTAPIINQPQVAILSTDGVRRRPVVVNLPDGQEAIAIHSVGVLALSFDHRVVDGAYAARFLKTVQSIIETRDWEAEL
jgi:pyruvate dehydrogenase E2 component (dihydrolipoamide acetyltransferase)